MLEVVFCTLYFCVQHNEDDEDDDGNNDNALKM